MGRSTTYVLGALCAALLGGGFIGYGVYNLNVADDWDEHSNRTLCSVQDFKRGDYCDFCGNDVDTDYVYTSPNGTEGAQAVHADGTRPRSSSNETRNVTLGSGCDGYQWTYTVTAPEECGTTTFRYTADCAGEREHDIGDLAPCWVHDGCTKVRLNSPSAVRTTAIVAFVFGGILACPLGAAVVVLVVLALGACGATVFAGCSACCICNERDRSNTHGDDAEVRPSATSYATPLYEGGDDTSAAVAAGRPYYGGTSTAYPSAPASYDAAPVPSAPMGAPEPAGDAGTTSAYVYSYNRPHGVAQQGTGATQQYTLPSY